MQRKAEDGDLFRGRFVAPVVPPCRTGFLPLTEACIDGFVRPAAAFCVNIPMYMFARGATQLAHVAGLGFDKKLRTSRSFESTAALAGLLSTPVDRLVALSGKMSDVAMRSTFSQPQVGEQHRSFHMLECVFARQPARTPTPARDGDDQGSVSSGSGVASVASMSSSASTQDVLAPQLVALRLWLVAVDPAFAPSRLVGLQIANNARLKRLAACVPPAKAGTPKRKRQEAEAAAEAAEQSVPNPATARARVCSVADYIYHLQRYADDGNDELANGQLDVALNSGIGRASATTLLAPLAHGSSQETYVHVASPEATLRLSRGALGANLGGLGALRRYTEPNQYRGDNAFIVPARTGTFLLVPQDGVDALTTPFPPQLQRAVNEVQRRGVHGGHLTSEATRFEKLPPAEL